MHFFHHHEDFKNAAIAMPMPDTEASYTTSMICNNIISSSNKRKENRKTQQEDDTGVSRSSNDYFCFERKEDILASSRETNEVKHWIHTGVSESPAPTSPKWTRSSPPNLIPILSRRPLAHEILSAPSFPLQQDTMFNLPGSPNLSPRIVDHPSDYAVQTTTVVPVSELPTPLASMYISADKFRIDLPSRVR